MKNLVKIILLLMLPVFASAQSAQRQLDSLQVALKNAANDTIRMDVYFQLGGFYRERNRDSSLFYLNKSIPIAQQLRLKLDEASALSLKSYMLMSLSNYPLALESLLQSLKIAENPASEKHTWNLPKDQTPHNARLDQLAWATHNMGNLYGATGNTDKQIANYYNAIDLAEQVQDTYLLTIINMSLGNVYLNLNKLDTTLLFEQRALHLNANLPFGKSEWEGTILTLIGAAYQGKGDYHLAMDAYLKAVQANKKHNILSYLVDNYGALAKLHETLKRPDSSLVYARKALETAQIMRQPQILVKAYQILSDVYSSQKNRDSTLKYLQLYTALHDSLNKVEKKNLVAYQNVGFDEQIRLQKLEEEKIQMQSKIRTNSLAGGLFTLIVISFFLYRNNRQKQKANRLIAKQKEKVESTLSELKSTQSQLIQSEKMASLGELTAGIAHEIQNPLNFVNNFSEVNSELISELKEEIEKGDKKEALNLANDIAENEQKINHHGKRADAIVKGMLQHSRTSTGQKELTDINALADEYLRLAYHGFLAKDKSFNVEYKTMFDETLPKINVIPQDIGRVLLNLINNAFYAVGAPANTAPPPPEGGIKKSQAEHKPTVIVRTSYLPPSGGMRGVKITVKDNGPGIPQNIVDKIFQPFFTTKPTGQGTGLGLSLSYDIVKAHGGELSVETKEGEGSEFIIYLPFIKN